MCVRAVRQPLKVIGNGCFGKVMMVKFRKNGIGLLPQRLPPSRTWTVAGRLLDGYY